MNPEWTILYEDNHLLVVNKSGGLLTQSDETDQDSLEAQLKAWLKQKYQKPGQAFLGVVHRLDKPVSGVVLFAKTSKALSRLNAAIQSKQSEKIYLALVEGVPVPSKGSIESYLFHDKYKATICPENHPQAKKALLHYQVLQNDSQKALVEIHLETGRYHQIRAQFSSIGHPIIGDTKYGSRFDFEENKIALHHFRLKIVHPVKGDFMVFESNCPFKM